jgi:hypothetical protein
MAVVHVSTLTLKPGGLPKWLEMMKPVYKAMEAAGARNMRTLVPVVAPEVVNTVVLTWEADDYGTWGSVLGKTYQDPAIIEGLVSHTGPDGPVLGVAISTFTDVRQG